MVFPAIAFALLTAVLVTAAVCDARTGKVFNWLTYPAMLGGLAFAAVWGTLDAQAGGAWPMVQRSAIAMAVGLVGMGLLASAGGLGWGDVKLTGAIGALSASWQVVASAAIYAWVVALAMAIVVMVRRGLVRRTFGRLANVALLTGMRARATLPQEDSPRIPFAVGLAIGGMLAAAEVLLGLPTPWAPAW